MRVGIIGLGNIGGGLARVLAGHHDLVLYDRKEDQSFAGEGGRMAVDLDDLSQNSEVIIVAVKPKDLPDVAKKLKTKKGQLVVSVAAGIEGASLRKLFSKAQTVRLMPNVALSVGRGVMAIEEDQGLDAPTRQQLETLLAPTGEVVWLPSYLIEPIGALAGSGLAYVMVVLEAMADAGITLGFSATEARRIAAQTMLGAAELVCEKGEGLSDQRWQVSSPGGTTMAGYLALEEGGVRAAMIEAVLAAHARAKTLVDDV